MTEYPLVSIIIVTFNASKTICDAVDSVLNNSYPNLELIVIDGKSTDNTVDLLNRYDSEKLTYISEKDHGIYDAMNKGVKLSKGEWLLFLGADDQLLRDGVADLIISSDGADVVYGNVKEFHSASDIRNVIAKDYHIVRTMPFGCHQCILMRKSVIEKLNGFDLQYRIVADFDLIQRAYIANFRFRKVESYIALFNMSGISSNNYRTNIEWWRICKKNRSTKNTTFVLLYHLARTLKKKINRRIFF